MSFNEMDNNIKIFTFDEVESEEILWLWKPYIALGKITVIQGDPGTGKTTFALAIAALISKKRKMPTGNTKPVDGNVIFQSGEDSPKDTIKPRLVACKADCSKIAFIESDVGLDLKAVENAIVKTNAKLIVIDPLQAFLSANQDITSTKNMRPLLRELGNVAERTGAALIIIGHMNKNDRAKGIYRGLGSIDITAAARSVLLIGKRKNDDNMRFMAQIKNNLTAFGRAVSFSINKKGGVEFHGECDISEDELLSVAGDRKTKYEIAKETITAMLSDGDRKSNEIYDACMKAGVSTSLMSYTKKQLGIQSVKKIDDWYWTMSSDGIDVYSVDETDETPVKFLDDATLLQQFDVTAEPDDKKHDILSNSKLNETLTIKKTSSFGEIELLDWRSSADE